VATSAWIDLIGTLVATGTGAWLGYLLAGRQERRRDARLHAALRKALLAEIEENAWQAWQAKIYPEQPVLGTANRLMTTVFESAFPALIGTGELSPESTRGILAFYSLVRQVNWCLDQIHRHLLENDLPAANREAERLLGKLEENEIAPRVALLQSSRSGPQKIGKPFFLRRAGVVACQQRTLSPLCGVG
jgi:hypothetical protein